MKRIKVLLLLYALLCSCKSRSDTVVVKEDEIIVSISGKPSAVFICGSEKDCTPIVFESKKKNNLTTLYCENVTDKSFNGNRLKIVYDSQDRMALRSRIPDSDYITSVVDSLVGIRNYRDSLGADRLNMAKEFIKNEFYSNGLEVTEQSFNWDDVIHSNIIGVHPGTELSNVYILGAHIDTVLDSPGADDNLSGISAMLEVMKIISRFSFRSTIVFVAFDLEEYGSIGSKEFLRVFKDKDINISGLINFDMIGYYSDQDSSQYFPNAFKQIYPEVYDMVLSENLKGNFVIDITNDFSSHVSNNFKANLYSLNSDLKYVELKCPRNGVVASQLKRSDHAPFWKEQIPAISIGDGADTRNPYYHAEQDTPEHLDYEKICQIVSITASTLANMAEFSSDSVVYYDIDIPKL